MKTNSKLFGDILSAGTIAVLFLVILLLVVFGAVSYQGSAEVRDENDNTRAVLTYVVTAVKGSTGEVILSERGGKSLVRISDSGTRYEQQIFGDGGEIFTAYVKSGTEPDPEDAVRIGRTDLFEAEWQAENLLRIRTDAGTSYVKVRRNG